MREGVADLRTKAIVKFLQKYIPGNPTIVSQYVPGGGGRQAANQVYRAAPDGLTIGACSPGVLSSAVLGEAGVEYDPYKFIYLGSPFSENINMFATRKPLGINSLENCAPLQGSESAPNRWDMYSTFGDGCSPGFWMSKIRDL